MKTKLLLLTITSASLALAGCGDTTTTNTNTRNGNVANLGTNNASNAYVVNSNATNTVSTNSNRWGNANISREEYNRDRAEYERDKRSTETIGQGANDSWLWTKTRLALMTTSDLRESTIDVDAVNDVITLKGTVETAAQKTKAEQVAKGIDGVKSVKNELKVAPEDSMTNTSGGNTNTRGANTNANANRR